MGTSNSTSPITCDRCGCSIAPSDLQQGLAIRIGNEVVCPTCVDSLPSDTQLKINQIRAMRGMDSTTYRINDPRRPSTQLYTFSTTANLIRHRHSLRTSGRFDAPLLPKDQRTVSHRSEVVKIAPTPRAQHKASMRLYATIGSVIVLVIAATFVLWPRSTPDELGNVSTPTGTAATDHSEAYETISKTVDPLQALDAAQNTYNLPSDNPVVVELYKEIIQKKKRELDAAEAAFDNGAIDRSKELLALTTLPTEDRRFVFLRDRQANIEQQIFVRENPPPEPQPIITSPVIEDLQNGEQGASTAQQQVELENGQQTIVDNSSENAVDPETPQNGNDVIATEPPVEDSSIPSENLGSSAQTAAEPAIDPTTLSAMQSPLPEMFKATSSSGQHAWEYTYNSAHDYRLKLLALSGALNRDLELQPGTYKIWVNGHSKNDQASVQASFDSQTLRYSGGNHSGSRYKWFALDGEIALEKATIGSLLLNFVSSDEKEAWYLRDVLIADARLENPEQLAEDQAKPIAWQALPPPPAPKGPSHLSLTFNDNPTGKNVYQPLKQWELDPKAPESDKESGANLPYFVGPLIAKSINAQQINTKRLGLTTIKDTDGSALVIASPTHFDLSSGKIKCTIYPSRTDRSEISIRLADSNDIPSPQSLSITVEPGKVWQTIEVNIPNEWHAKFLAATEEEKSALFNPERIKQVTIVDEIKRQTTPFYVASVDLISDASDTKAGELPKRSLIHANIPSLRTLRNNKIDPDKIRILVPVHLNPDWHTKMRERMTKIIQPPKDRLPNGTISKMTMHNDALNKEFIDAYLDRDKVRHHVVMVMTAGIEFHTGQNRQQALRQFWLKMLDEARDSDFLPVVVLGPTKVNEEFVEEKMK